MKIFDVDRTEIPISLFILFWLQYTEFGFPETEQGLVHPEHVGHFPHGIIMLLKQDFVFRNLDQIGFFGNLPDGFSASAGFDCLKQDHLSEYVQLDLHLYSQLIKSVSVPHVLCRISGEHLSAVFNFFSLTPTFTG